MPEGDTLFRIAHQLRHSIDGRRIERALSPLGRVVVDCIEGHTVTAIEARGKHLLIFLDSGDAIHSHLGMTGSWHVYAVGQRWHKSQELADLVLEFAELSCVCFHSKTLEKLSRTALRRHPHLARLGPDLLGNQFDMDEALKRFRRRDDVPIGVALMDQTIISGIGNVYKSEILFLEGLDPFQDVSRLSDYQLRTLFRRAQYLLRKNVGRQPRRTRFGHDGKRHWVYGRSGEKCLKCGGTIHMRRQGDLGRSTYWCPPCQEVSGTGRRAGRP
ncbi:MAG: hypothetical protein CMJ80_14495 [Planctomycetaceae bacterium]|nr:hypothetical protein [Planctomycetaceae bacterium]